MRIRRSSMDNSAEDGGAHGAPPENRTGISAGAKPKGRPGRKPKGSVPTVVTEMPDRPDPGVRPEAEQEEKTAMDIPPQGAAYVPLVGRIAAGGPILAEEEMEDIS